MEPPAPETIYERTGAASLARRLGDLGAKRILVLCSRSRRQVDALVDGLRALGPDVVATVFDGARVHVPSEVVDAATQVFAEARPDTLVSVGGGSAIGLGKALRLSHQFRFVALPTTYSGSEMTSIWGITRGNEKVTGRDPRVRPDLVLYDATLTADLPVGLTIQSLMNALAHPISALFTDSLAGNHRAEALTAISALLRAMEDLLLVPRDLTAREAALRASGAAALALDRGKAGPQHAAAHFLGGALGLDHAALHSVLLPQFVAHVRLHATGLMDELEHAAASDAFEAYLHDLLTRAAAPTSLDALGVDEAVTRNLLASRPDLPAAMILDAQHGLRPTRSRIAMGPPPLALLSGPHPDQARRAVLALHGRGAEAGGIVRRFGEIVGHAPDTSIIGLRAAEGGNRWYGVRYGDAGAGTNAEVTAALARVDSALADLARSIPRSATTLAGFSQGACLALEYAARRGQGLAAVVAPCGARLGLPSEWASSAALGKVRVLMGAGAKDPWVDRERIEASAAWFREAGALVEVIDNSGERHDIAPRQRLAARNMIRGLVTDPGASGAQPNGLDEGAERFRLGLGGFGNAFESEAVAGALPRQQNSPRLPPFGLYAEQINGTGFAHRRAENLRSWLYRVRPASQRRAFEPLAHPRFGADFTARPSEVNLCGWAPLPTSDAPRDFLDGLVTLAGAGAAELRRGCAIHLYSANRDMDRRAFYNADGDLLLIPEHGTLTLLTEFGALDVAPGQIAILPRGVVFSVLLAGPSARGYVGEAYGRHFQLPERGPVGANGLADPRHFRAPEAWYEDRLSPDFRIVAKLGGRLHQASQDHSPFDVVAWHGNYVPTRYDFADFSPVGSVRFDHPDPSLYTVLSAPLDEQGANTLDLIAFVPRWDVSQGTFRPPYFHRNPVSEVNGIIREHAAPGSPFQPGCCFITPVLTAHGPSGLAVQRTRFADDAEADKPAPPGKSLWFQLETALPLSLTSWAEDNRVKNWPATWGSHRSYFDSSPGKR